MATKAENQLIQALKEKGLIPTQTAESLVQESAQAKETVYALLIKKRLVDEDALLTCLGETLKIRVLSKKDLQTDKAVIDKVPLKIAEYYKMVPLKIEKRKLTIAVSRPLDLRTQDDIRAHLGYEIEMALAREQDVLDTIKRMYGFGAQTIGDMVAQDKGPARPAASSTAGTDEIEDIEKAAGDASIAKLVNQIILEAYKKRASDIHIEPYRGKVRLRYRIDGTLYDAHVQAEMGRFILPVLSRIKIMSNLNIVERRLPQDGRAIVKVEEAQLDLRVSSIPTPYGESVVIRILPMNRVFDLALLGLGPTELEIFEQLIQKPHGIILITGPTGSGKSTTLYACLNRLNGDERKIITIEDPVEYEMEGVTQIQVMPNIGLDFARGLRSILRHDPDVIMVGEVRDLETAEIAIRVALTGHLVFSTLHTNDAASGATRLIDIGVEPYLVASSVEVFVAQRLVRVLCPKCKEQDSKASELKALIAKEMKMKSPQFVIYRSKGCDHCAHTGFMGRMAIYEIMKMSEKVRQLIIRRATAGEIKHQALADGMRTLRQDGWRKVVEGLTTPEEIFEVTEIEPGQIGDNSSEEPLVPSVSSKGFERRVFVRMRQAVNVRYEVVKWAGGTEKAIPKGMAGIKHFTTTSNLSAGGLAFTAKESLPVGAILDLKLEIPDEDPPLACLVRVVRQEEFEENQVYELAVCFLDLSAAARSRMDKFVASHAAPAN